METRSRAKRRHEEVDSVEDAIDTNFNTRADLSYFNQAPSSFPTTRARRTRDRLSPRMPTFLSPTRKSPCLLRKESIAEGSSMGESHTSGGDTTIPAFPKFKLLPPELRLHIWRLFRQLAQEQFHPLRVRLYRGHERVQKTGGRRAVNRAVLRMTPMPDLAAATETRRYLLRICSEARYEFMRDWSATLELNRGGILRFDPETDIVFLDIRNMRVIEDMVQMRESGICPEFARNIGHIGFDMAPRLPHWSTNSRLWLDPRLDFILCFPSLHSLSLISLDSFDSEIDWQDSSDVTWFLSRSMAHSVRFRAFQALERANYNGQCAVGTRVFGNISKHECVICTIHKCVYVRDFLKNESESPYRPHLTDQENKWLAKLKYNTLVIGTPQMHGKVKAFGVEMTAEELEEEEQAMRDPDDDDGGDVF